MKKLFLAMLFVLLMASGALAVTSPHMPTLGCLACHVNVTPGNILNGITGVNNLCITCHNPSLMTKGFVAGDIANPFNSTNLGLYVGDKKQTSHNWAAPVNVPAAGAATPNLIKNSATGAPLHATSMGVISCASCHDNHAASATNPYPDLFRFPNNSDQLCFDCHRSRNTTDQTKGTHPVAVNYAATVAAHPTAFYSPPQNANPANPTSAMKLVGGQVICSTCHGIHFTDSNSRTVDGPDSAVLGLLSSSQGYLLRTDLRGGTANAVNICTNCHAGKLAHNRNGQNIQCADCHAGHVDPGDGTVPNVWLVRRYMNYSAGVKLSSYRRPVFNQYTDSRSNFAGKNGVCQACHFVPPPGGSFPAEHASTDPNVCRGCHVHNSTDGSFSASCKSCHGFPPQANTAGGPLGYASTASYNYATSPAFKDESMTPHIVHAGQAPYTYGCSECHLGNKHATGNFQQVFNTKTGIVAATGGAVPTYNIASPGTCSNVYCHSNGAPAGGGTVYKSPTWATAKGSIVGTPSECSACHDASPATNAHPGHLSFGFACAFCHAATVATVSSNTTIKDTSKHVNGVKDVLFSGTATIGGTGSYDGTAHTCSNLYCHSNGNQGALVYANPAAWNSGVNYGCNGCHGTSNTIGAPDYPNTTLTANTHGPHTTGATTTTVCSNCHFATASSTTGGTIADKTKHLNGAVDVVFNPATAGSTATWDPATRTCTNVVCHGGAPAQWGSTAACLTCHSFAINGRAAIGPQFGANSHHVQGTSVTATNCYQCHWEANSDGSINHTHHHSNIQGGPVELVIYGAGSRPTVYNAGTTAIPYTANGNRAEIAKINDHCLGCHSDQNNTTIPFGDGKTPKSYAWDGASIGTKYKSITTTPWGKYAGANVTPKNTVTKAFSAHGNAVNNKGGWDLTETWTDRKATANVLCFDCHNSHGSTATGTTTSYASATTNGGILKATTAGKGGYSVTYQPAAGGSAAAPSLNAYNAGAGLCFDCHMNPSATNTPWGYNSTFGSTQQILGYWDSAYFGSNTFPSSQRYPYKSQPNKGGHFGHSSSLTTQVMGTIGGLCTPCHDPHGVSPTLGVNNMNYGVPLLKGTWMTSPYKEDTCPKGVNESRGAVNEDADRVAYTFASTPGYNIDQNTFETGTPTTSRFGGTNPVWNFKSTKRATESVDQFAGLCIKCHPKSSIAPTPNPNTPSAWKSVDRIHNTVKGWGTYGGNANNAAHSYTCAKCHTPHNSNLPRLMVTNCLDYSHRGQVFTGGPAPSRVAIRGEEGNGAGGFPGGGKMIRAEENASRRGSYFFNSPACHDTTNSVGFPANQLWNNKTPWGTAGPAKPPTNTSGGHD